LTRQPLYFQITFIQTRKERKKERERKKEKERKRKKEKMKERKKENERTIVHFCLANSQTMITFATLKTLNLKDLPTNFIMNVSG
jgi:hypothetical protein